jgi:hypothetical protein
VSAAYPETPPGWGRVEHRRFGPFTTHVRFRTPDGDVVDWSSRAHRKRGAAGEDIWWAPRRLSWWIGVLFAIGSLCFTVGPLPGFVEWVGSAVDGLVFFVGSIFFTTAAGLQCVQSFNTDRGPAGHGRRRFRLVAFEPRRIDWWSCVTQFAGTLLFNVDTFHAMTTGFDNTGYDRLVWTPDTLGSALFLVSGYLAYVEVCGGFSLRPRRGLDWSIAAVNLLGCVFFGISAIAAFVVPATGSVVDLAAANAFTALGGACFFAGAVLLLPEAASPSAESAA